MPRGATHRPTIVSDMPTIVSHMLAVPKSRAPLTEEERRILQRAGTRKGLLASLCACLSSTIQAAPSQPSSPTRPPDMSKLERLRNRYSGTTDEASQSHRESVLELFSGLGGHQQPSLRVSSSDQHANGGSTTACNSGAPERV